MNPKKKRKKKKCMSSSFVSFAASRFDTMVTLSTLSSHYDIKF